ncbi:hypothetical protein LTS18_007644 [Coniosporium uncinatum]|uniref:Uncharacterized protein n=1 Tax=Coniosporium uncinatum TaxID=93489 RepID=A0ACC3D2R8_9PEZI|nr:hypothetical protein LTS18_007644 [Coniosporium uncinatum]
MVDASSDNPIPRPRPVEEIQCDTSKHYNGGDSCYPLDKATDPAWSLREVFGRPIKGICSLVDQEEPKSETVCINVPAERKIQVQTNGTYSEVSYDEGFLRCYQPAEGQDFDIFVPEQELSTKTPLKQPPLYASRAIVGHGQERGGTQSILVNPSATESVRLIYLESLPWFMKPYLHTLRANVHTNGRLVKESKPILETHYRPAVDRHRGSHLELLLRIPPASTLTLTYDFDKAILRYTEYPPDANRGFDAAPAVIRLLNQPSPDVSSRKGTYLRTTSLLLPLPTPDFSMPYNVIILTSTVMALGFGTIFNLLVRRFVGADEVEEGRLAVVVAQARERVKGRLQVLIKNVKGKGSKVD